MNAATDVLRREHTNISIMAQVLHEMTVAYETGTAIDEPDLSTVANFFIRYADRLHHTKEEIVLFPAVLARDNAQQGLIALLIDDHRFGRQILAEIEEAIANEDTDAYFAAVREYVRYITRHIDYENRSLFPVADALLSHEAQEQLATRLASLQQECITMQELRDWDRYRMEMVERYHVAALV